MIILHFQEVFNKIHVEMQNDWFNEMKFSKQDFVPAIACVQKKNLNSTDDKRYSCSLKQLKHLWSFRSTQNLSNLTRACLLKKSSPFPGTLIFPFPPFKQIAYDWSRKRRKTFMSIKLHTDTNQSKQSRTNIATRNWNLLYNESVISNHSQLPVSVNHGQSSQVTKTLKTTQIF